MSEFYVGQKVVCVDDTKLAPFGRWDGLLRKGGVYTVAATVWRDQDSEHYVRSGVKVFLAGVTRGPCLGCGEQIPFAAERFRPLEEQSKAMQIFRAIAANPTIKIKENA